MGFLCPCHPNFFQNLLLSSDFDDILYEKSLFECLLKIKTKCKKKRRIGGPPSLSTPPLKFENLHLLSNSNEILYEISLFEFG